MSLEGGGEPMGHGAGSGERRAHWDAVYERGRNSEFSWDQAEPTCSLALLEALRVGPDASVVDIGGSRLVDALVARGFTDLAVVGVSNVALKHAQRRLGAVAGRVRWVAHDVLLWNPEEIYDLWHDRAVFHRRDPVCHSGVGQGSTLMETPRAGRRKANR
ncbi:MAG TPA: class I SAM-dependent methyltransferase [Bacillota bacterium]|nr:class I SAM-dependent methyltransferase [Bacillota bacterium]